MKSEEIKDEGQTEEIKAEVVLPEKDAMGSYNPRHPVRTFDFDSDCFVDHIGVRPLKDDPSRTEAFVESREKIDDLVREASKTVGLEVALQQIARGLVDPDKFVDDGEGFIDDVNGPAGLFDLKDKAEKNKQTLDAMAKAFGIDLNGATVENLQELIDKALKENVAQQTVSTNEGGQQ